MMVRTAKMLGGVRSFPSVAELIMAFFEKIPRTAKLKFEPRAELKDCQVKLNSFSEAMITPPTTGTKHMLTCHGEIVPMTAVMREEKNGSEAFTMWVNDTEPAPREITVNVCPRVWKRAIGKKVV